MTKTLCLLGVWDGKIVAFSDFYKSSAIWNFHIVTRENGQYFPEPDKIYR